MEKELLEALYRKAIGYDVSEIVEEYNADGDIVKRKVSTKYVPPDVSALKIYLEEGDKENNLAGLSDEELEREKMRLLDMLKERCEDENRKRKI